MATMSSAQEIIAKALWADGNNRIGHRPWESVKNAYMAEAGHAIAALRARSFEERLHLMSSVLGIEAQLLVATMGEPGPVRYFLCDLNNPTTVSSGSSSDPTDNDSQRQLRG